MLAPARVAEIHRLLAEGRLSRRAVARAVGVSRNTVAAIALGRRPDYELLRRPADDEPPLGPPRRCPGCGGMVYLPCRLCRMRRRLAAGARRPFDLHCAAGLPPLGLELRPDHYQRYLRVRRRKLRAIRRGLLDDQPLDLNEHDPSGPEPRHVQP